MFIFLSLGGAAQSSAFTNFLTGISVAILAGLVVFGLNWFREWLTSYLKRKSEAEVLAFSLVNQLDRLIAECSDVVSDPRRENEDGNTRTTVKSPEVQFPDHWNWTVFPKKLQYQVRSLPNKIDAANRSVSSLFEWGDGAPDYSDAWEEREYRFAFIGLEAVLVNDSLAEKYGVPILDRGGWKPDEMFSDKIALIDQSRKEDKFKWEIPEHFKPKVPRAELDKRMSDLVVGLDIARGKLAKTAKYVE